MCGAYLKEKKMISENWKNWYIHMMQPLKMVKFTIEVKNQDSHDLFLETLFWINLYPVKN